jgi:hypothetical protein
VACRAQSRRGLFACLKIRVYSDGMDNIDKLFEDTNVVSTSGVARAFDLSEAEARTWADELDVAKVGASFAWVRVDVEALAEQLDAPDEDESDVDSDDADDEGDEQDEDDENGEDDDDDE